MKINNLVNEEDLDFNNFEPMDDKVFNMAPPAIEEIPDTPPVMEAPKEEPVKKTKKTTKAKKEKKTDIAETEQIIPTTGVSFIEAVKSIESKFQDEQWLNFKKEKSRELSEIVISSDMNSIMIKETLAKLTNLRDSIWLAFIETKTKYDILSSKEPEGTIERIKRISSIGNNTEERKLNGVVAVMSSKDENGNVVNLYEVYDEIKGRYDFLKGLMDSISYKKDIMVTMLGSLKLEGGAF